jgi:hypothetical protein
MTLLGIVIKNITAESDYQLTAGAKNTSPSLPAPLLLNRWRYPRGLRTAMPEGIKKRPGLWSERLA